MADRDFQQTFRHAPAVIGGSLVLLFALYCASGFYSVNPQERGVVKRFGAVVDDNVSPGIHYHLPWPIETVTRERTTEVRSVTVHFRDTSNTDRVQRGGALLTGDENLVLTSIVMQYAIKSPRLYLNSAIDPDGLLSRLAQATTVEIFAGMKIDEVFTTGRQQVQTLLRQRLQKNLDDLDLGIRLLAIQTQVIEPPPKVSRAFKDVASAREDRHKVVEEARGQRNRDVPKARSDAQSMVQQSQSFANEAIERAKGDADRFTTTWKEYRKAKNLTAYRLYLETVEELLPRVKKMLINPQAESNMQSGPRNR